MNIYQSCTFSYSLLLFATAILRLRSFRLQFEMIDKESHKTQPNISRKEVRKNLKVPPLSSIVDHSSSNLMIKPLLIQLGEYGMDLVRTEPKSFCEPDIRPRKLAEVRLGNEYLGVTRTL